MRIVTPATLGLLGLSAILAISLPVAAATATTEAIGIFTSVTGKVSVTHTGAATVTPVTLRANVLFKDRIETQADSRTRALFQDDSILTVGANSRVDILEHVYNPAHNQRSTVLKLVNGKARALVGKLFEGAGSKFEVHTATASVAARGTYFVVWIEETTSTKVSEAGPHPDGQTAMARRVSFPEMLDAHKRPRPSDNGGATGVANIGDSGDVAFTSAGKTILVKPGMISTADPGSPPAKPVPLTVATAPTAIPDTGMSEQRVPPTDLSAPPLRCFKETQIPASSINSLVPPMDLSAPPLRCFKETQIPAFSINSLVPPSVTSGAAPVYPAPK